MTSVAAACFGRAVVVGVTSTECWGVELNVCVTLAAACSLFSQTPLREGSREMRSGARSSPLSHAAAVCSGTAYQQVIK